LNRFVNWLKKEKTAGILPHNLTADMVYKYRLYLSRQISQKDGKLLKKNTQNYYLIALRALLTYFVKKDIISLPVEKISLAKEKNNRKINFLNIEQLEKLLLSPTLDDLSGIRDRAILETLFSTGLRVGELVALNREQINIDYIKSHNVKTLELPITGKGGYTRTVYFSPRALKYLVMYLEKRTDDDKALFVNLKRGEIQESRRLISRSVEKIVKKYVKLSGVPIETSPHTLRHSYATDLLEQGVDLRTIQEFLGHRDIGTTQVYTHVTNKHLKDVHRAFHSGRKMKE
ncbi:MAG: tyrosine-type recombinase/integrase, partial [bacterium]